MLHILLMILKIAGIILAVLLCTVLFLILIVLFVPIRYRVKAAGELGAEIPAQAEVKITWLLHIVNAALVYRENAYLRIRIFCFPIFDSRKEKKEKKPKKTKKTKQGEGTEAEQEEGTETEPEPELIEQKADVVDENSIDTEYNRNAEKTIDAGEEDAETEGNGCVSTPEPDAAPDSESRNDEQKTSIFQKISRKIKTLAAAVKKIITKILDALKNIEYTIQGICDKIRKIIENISYYTEVLQSDVFHAAFGVSKKQLLKVLRMLKPTKCRIHLLAGTGDPASTGRILAIYGMVYPFVGNHIFIESDFEEKVLKGDAYIRGRVRVITLLVAAIRLYTDKNIRKLLKLLKREDA